MDRPYELYHVDTDPVRFGVVWFGPRLHLQALKLNWLLVFDKFNDIYMHMNIIIDIGTMLNCEMKLSFYSAYCGSWSSCG